MSIATYAELQTAVSEWLHRSGLSARAPDFIRKGQSWLNRKLRTVDMEETYSFNMSTDDRLDPLPSGYLELQSLNYTASPVKEIVFAEPSALIPLITESGKPEYFTIKDGLEWNRTPDAAYACEMHYFKALDLANDSTNWLLTNHPDIYLYASLASAAIYIKDDNRVPGIKSLLQEAVDDLNTQDARKRGSQMVLMRTELVSGNDYNIITG